MGNPAGAAFDQAEPENNMVAGTFSFSVKTEEEPQDVAEPDNKTVVDVTELPLKSEQQCEVVHKEADAEHQVASLPIMAARKSEDVSSDYVAVPVQANSENETLPEFASVPVKTESETIASGNATYMLFENDGETERI